MFWTGDEIIDALHSQLLERLLKAPARPAAAMDPWWFQGVKTIRIGPGCEGTHYQCVALAWDKLQQLLLWLFAIVIMEWWTCEICALLLWYNPTYHSCIMFMFSKKTYLSSYQQHPTATLW